MNDSIKDKFLANPARYSEEAYDSLRQRLLTIEQKYAIGVPKFDFLFAYMASAHENLGLLAYFARGNLAALKQHWHLASRLSVRAANHVPESTSYTTGGWMAGEYDLLYALCSDSRSAIDEVAALETFRLKTHRDNPRAREFNFHLAQLVIRGDYEAAQAKIALGAKKAGGKLKQAYATGTDFYSLLMKGDKATLEKSIMESSRFRRSGGEPYIFDFVYPGATFRAKLCWYKGIPVEIEHPMVPMAWMPIQPLPQYDDIYDFLSPDWTPPDQGFMARLSRKFQKSFPEIDACMARIRNIDKRC
jgi:hypothetical protein